ncbi:Uncharacterised protein [Mycobacteroides abscessus subsp. abscessus]|nr:Uncharacterised protein [Mycobacteroides abscessus subsp. abscessus]
METQCAFFVRLINPVSFEPVIRALWVHIEPVFAASYGNTCCRLIDKRLWHESCFIKEHSGKCDPLNQILAAFIFTTE